MNKAFYRCIYKAAKLYWRIFQPTTHGARVICEHEGKFVLVNPKYSDGWQFPGGGVKKHEDYKSAAIREFVEETGVTPSNVQLVGVYYNDSQNHPDHIALFTAQIDSTDFKPTMEIEACRLFDDKKLPKIDGGSINRLRDYRNGHYESGKWNDK